MVTQGIGRAILKGTVLAVAASLALSACGTGGATTGNGGTAEASTLGTGENPITWMAALHTANTPEADGPIETAIEDLTGAKVTFQWYPAASTEEKINTGLASGTLAHMVTLGGGAMIGSSSVRTAMSSGVFWDVEPYLADYPNLAKIPTSAIESGRIDGKLYGVPFVSEAARYGVVVRQDWLDNLGLEAPHTIEDLTKVALAFTNDDPDGNGQNDTVGFVDRSESFQLAFNTLAGYFGAGNKFQVTDDGKVVPSFTTDEFKHAMAWYRGVYEKGAVNQEFITMQKTNQRDAIARGVGGIVVTGLFEAKSYVDQAKSIDPSTPMTWALINDMTYQDVPRRIISDTNGGMGGWLAIPKSYAKTEADLRAVLSFIDKLSSEEGYRLQTSGIEGTHYSRDAEGVIRIIDQTLWEQQVQPYSSSRPNSIAVRSKNANPLVNEANEKMAENEEYVVLNPAQTLTSATFDTQWSMIEQKATDAYNKYMNGQLDMVGYEAAIDALGGEGLDQIVEEFTAAQAKVKQG